MPSKNNGKATNPLGFVIGGILLLAAVSFFWTGGGVKDVSSDADLPPVASPERK